MSRGIPLDSGTRDRILDAAGELFAECGFRGTTVRKISARARVNVSAIKYHFGGKEQLYYEVLGHWHAFAIKKYPPLLGVGEEGSPEQRLTAFIRSLLFRMLDKGKPAWSGKVMAREMIEPTKAFDRLLNDMMDPLSELLESIVRSLIGNRADEETVRFVCASLIGQCAFYCNTRVISRLFRRDMSSPEAIEQIANHVVRFTLQSLRHYSGAAAEKTSGKVASDSGKVTPE
jgi:TetR/AcrR family transcriptional regulator, regulator of cefoperazone and chloramphenicol sensitivity